MVFKVDGLVTCPFLFRITKISSSAEKGGRPVFLTLGPWFLKLRCKTMGYDQFLNISCWFKKISRGRHPPKMAAGTIALGDGVGEVRVKIWTGTFEEMFFIGFPRLLFRVTKTGIS